MSMIILTAMGKVLVSMGMKLVSTEALEEMVLWSLKKLAAHTESKADDELVAIVEKHLQK